MAWDAGAMVGRVILDKSGYTAPLRQVVAEAQAAGPKIDRAIGQPFQPASSGLRQFLGELGKVQGVAAGLSILPGRMGSFAVAIGGAIGFVGQLSTMLMASSAAAGVTSGAYLAAGAAGVASSTAVYRAVTNETVAIQAKTGSTTIAAAADRGAALAAMQHAYANLQLAASIRAVQVARASSGASNAIVRARRGGGGGATDDLVGEYTVRRIAALPGPTNAAAASMSGLASAAGATGPALGIVAGAAAAVLTPFIGLGAITAALKSDFVQVAGQMQRTEASFKTMLGSSAAAKRMLQELKDFNTATPFEFPEIAQTAKSLLNAGVSASQVTRHLQMLGDAATGADTDLVGLGAVYTQIANKGKADTEDLMQFANRNVPIQEALRLSLGVSKAKLQEMVTAGEIGFPQIEAAFKRLTSEGGKFHNAMANNDGLIDQLTSNLSDAWRTVKEEIGTALIEGMNLTGWVRQFTSLIQGNGDVIVGVFKMGVAQMQPFINLFGSVVNWVQSGIGAWRELSDAFDAAFGEGSMASVASFVTSLNPLVVTLKFVGALLDGIAWGLRKLADVFRTIKEGIEIVKTWWSGENGKPITQAEIDAEIAKRNGAQDAPKTPARKQLTKEEQKKAELDDIERRRRERQAAKEEASRPKAATPADANPKAEAKAAKDAADSADRVRSLQIDSRITQLRAAGKEAEAAQLELWARWEERYRKAVAAGNAAEAKQIEASYATEKAALTAQQEAEARRTQAEAEQAAFDSRIATRIAQLKAAGKDSEAEQLALWQRFNKDMKAADGNEAERQQLFARYWAESGEIKKRDADAAARTEQEHQREMEQSRLRAAGRDEEAQRAQARYEREDSIAKDNSAEARRRADERYVARIGEIDRAEAEKTAKERQRLADQLMQRARGDLGELDQLSAADRAAAYASQSRLVSFGPQVTSGIDRYLGSPTQPARAIGAEPSPAKATADALAPVVDKLRGDVEKINENVNELTRVTLRNIERNTDKFGETKVVKF